MERIPTAYLIYGYLAAGKSTFGSRLAEERGALFLSEDEWYLRLFSDGTPTTHRDQAAWDRLSALLDDLWPAVLRQGVDVVLDFGFWSRQRRDLARRLAFEAEAKTELYWVRCDESAAKERLGVRREEGGWNFSLPESAYQELLVNFESLGPDEPHRVVQTDR
jgi:predicted kinase